MRSLYLNTDALSPRARDAAFVSLTDRSPIMVPAFTLGETVRLNIYLVSPSNPDAAGYDAMSGDATRTLKVGLGFPGQTDLVEQDIWTILQDSSFRNIGWTGSLALITNALASAFLTSTGSLPYLDVNLEMLTQDASNPPKAVIHWSPGIRIYNSVIDPANLNQNYNMSGISGVFNIDNGTDHGTLTGLALGASPRLVQLTVTQPVGGLLLAANLVKDTLTTDGFTFYLSGVTDSANYKLNYTILF